MNNDTETTLDGTVKLLEDWRDDPIKVAINDYGNDIAAYTLKYIKNEITESDRNMLYVGSGEQLARKIEQLLSEQKQEMEEAITSVQIDYSSEGLGCGLEDNGITDRYSAAEYGFNEAIEKVREQLNLLDK